MLNIYWSSHENFLITELKKLLGTDTFASRMWQFIGVELHDRLVDWIFEDEVEYSRYFPVESLFLWALEGGLDIEFLADDEGNYLDDQGNILPSTIEKSYSAVEQLAAYGLWLVSEKSEILGEPPEQGFNEQGFNREDVAEHKAACLLLGYQALSYSQRILNGASLSVEEKQKKSQIDFSVLGKAGAAKRHAPMAKLRAWAIDRYKAGNWASANQAANELQNSVLEHGRSIGANLTKSNAQRTIAEWFRKSV